MGRVIVSGGCEMSVPVGGETWVLNETPSAKSTLTLEGEFSSNGQVFAGICFEHSSGNNGVLLIDQIQYYTSDGTKQNVFASIYNRQTLAVQEAWVSDSWRTIAFIVDPTGDLLTWLQANAVKQ